MKKRVLSLFMALALCLSMTPEVSYAEEAGAVAEQEAQSGESITDDTIGNDVSGGDVSDGDADVQDAEKDAAVRAVQDGGHTNHPVCGLSCIHGNQHANVADWTGVSELTNNMAAGYYYLTDDVKISETWELSANIVLCLNGYSITQTTANEAVKILAGGELTLADCKGGGTLTHATNVNGTGVYVAGTLTMYGGSVTGNTNTVNYSGGGVYVAGTFTMYGGSISGNTNTADTNTTSTNIGKDGGAGVFVKNGGVFTLNGGSISGNTNGSNNSAGGVHVKGTFTMGGGDITENKNTYAINGGGGVFVDGGTFTISNGKITKNTSAYYGGGVYINSGTFTMDGGSISQNESTERGGGVYVASNVGCTFDMINGEITGNTAGSYGGGGVYISISGRFNMYGGKITGNNTTSSRCAGGVYVSPDSTFTVSGEAQITGNWKNGTFDANEGRYAGSEAGNVYLAGSPMATIIIEKELNQNAQIGISTAGLPTAGNNVKIATGATNDALNYAGIFPLDMGDQSYSVIRDSDYNLLICFHRHSWRYEVSGDGATINAICKEDDCPNPNGGSVTIKAPDAGTLAYDGNPKTATLETKLPAGVTAPTITYRVKGSDSPIEAPVNAGTYIASITLKGVDGISATASVEYTIKADQAELRVTGDNTVVYGKTLTLGTTGGSGTGDVTFRIDKANSTGEATIAGNILTADKVGDVVVIATKAGDADYNEAVSEGLTITITQAAPTGKPAYTEITTDGKTLADAGLTLTGSTLSPAAGTLEWVDAEGKVLSGDTKVEVNKTYTWRFIPEDKNYGTLTGDVLLYLSAPEYRIIEGADSSWKQNVDGSLVIRGNGEFSDFQKVLVDGSEIDSVNYTAAEGSTIITLKPEFLSTLSEGSHTFEIVWTNGSAGTNFTVAKNTSGNNGGNNNNGNNNSNNNSSDNAGSSDGTADKTVIAPKTGDDSLDALLAVFVVVAFAGVAGMLVLKKKNAYK